MFSHRCRCGKKLSSEGMLFRHQNKCAQVRDHTDRLLKESQRQPHNPPPKKRYRLSESEEPLTLIEKLKRAASQSLKATAKLDEVIPSDTGSLLPTGSFSQSLEPDVDFDPIEDPNASSGPLQNSAQYDTYPTEHNQVTHVSPSFLSNSTQHLRRSKRLTARVSAFLSTKDTLPTSADANFEESSSSDLDSATDNAEARTSGFVIRIRRVIKTRINIFGLSRSYYGRPSAVPDARRALSDCVADDILPSPPCKKSKRSVREIIAPYPNLSSYKIGHWFWNGNIQKTPTERQSLLDGLSPAGPDDEPFKLDDVAGVNFSKIDEQLAADPGLLGSDNGWTKSTVVIEIPAGVKKSKVEMKRRVHYAAMERNEDRLNMDGPSNKDPPYNVHRFPVHSLYHRKLTHVIREVCASEESRDFHWHPFQHHWQPPWPGAKSEPVYGDLYTSQAFIDAYHELQNSPREPGCSLPRVICGVMMASDATHVAQFGQAKLWPGYILFGNQSNHDRPTKRKGVSKHFAYFPSLPDDIQDFIHECTNGSDGVSKAVSEFLLTHCRRELWHGCWIMILDDEFLHAWQHGIVVLCGDGIVRRVYPRIFVYLADYPEKVLLATIRNFGQCPCVRCRVSKDNLPNMGTAEDMLKRVSLARCDDSHRSELVLKARELIYNDGYVVNSSHVEDLLKDFSLVPTTNAFSSCLKPLGFDFHGMFAVDLLHEFELGVWKAVLKHLIRILHTCGSQVVQEFDTRFRIVAPFGRGTIRPFTHNTSELKQLPASKLEDILQCCIPCFDGLFPEPHNQTIADLLYVMVYWHGLAKLHMHTESSLLVLEDVTSNLGNALRFFAYETCTHFQTVETPHEYSSRQQRAVQKSTAAGEVSEAGGRRPKVFNLKMVKLHFLGDYASQIRFLGTTNTYSTRLTEALHPRLKGMNKQTNRNNAAPQIAKIEVREEAHARMERELQSRALMDENAYNPCKKLLDEITLSYQIAKDEKGYVYLGEIEDLFQDEPAFISFEKELRRHIFARIQNLDYFDEEIQFNQDQLDSIEFLHDRIYQHTTATFHYTTYDLQREQDTVNIYTMRRDIMLPSLANELNGHPYWYARILGIYHANIRMGHHHPKKQLDFLHVRWLGEDELGGPSKLRLDQIGFVGQDDPFPFSFLDPAIVIRACHLIPRFKDGKSPILLSKPSSSWDSATGDWRTYSVNRFVDRDMLMRYLGLGVGHRLPGFFPRENAQMRAVLSSPHYISSSGNEAGPTENSNQGFTGNFSHSDSDSVDTDDKSGVETDDEEPPS